MYIELTEIAPPLLRLEIEVPWETVASDYADACAVYRDVALPGFRAGHAPLTIITKKFAREIRTDAAQRCAARFTRDAIREKQLRTLGSVAVTEATLIPGEPFRCVAEFMKRPEITLPEYHAYVPSSPSADIEARRDEISDWLLANTRFSHDPTAPGQHAGALPAKTAPDPDETRLLLIAREIAERDGVAFDERQLNARLADMAAQAAISPDAYRDNLEKAGLLESFREFFLTETVLDYLATREPQTGVTDTSSTSISEREK